MRRRPTPTSAEPDREPAPAGGLTGPPFVGLAFWPQETNGKRTLLFESAQQKYVFERSPATNR